MSKYSISGRKDRLSVPNPYLQYQYKIKNTNTKKELNRITRYLLLNMNLTNEQVTALTESIIYKIKKMEGDV